MYRPWSARAGFVRVIEMSGTRKECTHEIHNTAYCRYNTQHCVFKRKKKKILEGKRFKPDFNLFPPTNTQHTELSPTRTRPIPSAMLMLRCSRGPQHGEGGLN
ncbi:hypothetical protein EVAR_81766_1 [Eumeta japonica]|uniref:Uncharacterized protein n=1 Tax=Eumeta variegata TaxID=151549 RepID=A0A4C1UJ24_EUMVA|nr:hypothetical protein EVAR_81766_1 [Eumeta japonica]